MKFAEGHYGQQKPYRGQIIYTPGKLVWNILKQGVGHEAVSQYLKIPQSNGKKPMKTKPSFKLIGPAKSTVVTETPGLLWRSSRHSQLRWESLLTD